MSAGRGAGYALLALAAVLLAISVLSAWSGISRLSERSDASSAARDAAVAFVNAYGTIDFRDPDPYTERLAAHTTGALRHAVAGAEMDPEFTRGQRSISTQVESASVTALSEREATVAVTAVQERRWVDAIPGTPQQVHIRQHVICRLLLEEGHWLVAELAVQSEEEVRPQRR